MTTSSLLLAHLPLRPSTLQLLQARGFTGVSEVTSAPLSSLAAEWKISLTEAGELVQEVQSCLAETSPQENPQRTPANHHSSYLRTTTATRSLLASNNSHKNNRPLSALEILSQQQSGKDGPPRSSRHHCPNACILTFSRAVDQLLGGGIALGQVTELAGAPGTGKTQWAMQAAVNAHLPVFTGGVAGRVVYVDTEGSFCPERCAAMAAALVKHVQGNLKRKHVSNTWDVTADDILASIDVYRCYDEATLWTVLHSLPARVEECHAAATACTTAQAATSQLPVRLIVIDSMAFLLRAGTSDSVGRSKLLMSTVSDLTQLAATHQLAVLGINQMTTKLNTTSGSTLVPALGESWAHAVTTRLLLRNGSSSGNNTTALPQERTCVLTKSPRLPTGVASFQIVEEGVRGLDFRSSEERPSSKRSRTMQ